MPPWRQSGRKGGTICWGKNPFCAFTQIGAVSHFHRTYCGKSLCVHCLHKNNKLTKIIILNYVHKSSENSVLGMIPTLFGEGQGKPPPNIGWICTPSSQLYGVDMGTAYTDAAGRTSPDFSELGTGNIGGLTLSPGHAPFPISILEAASWMRPIMCYLLRIRQSGMGLVCTPGALGFRSALTCPWWADASNNHTVGLSPTTIPLAEGIKIKVKGAVNSWTFHNRSFPLILVVIQSK